MVHIHKLNQSTKIDPSNKCPGAVCPGGQMSQGQMGFIQGMTSLTPQNHTIGAVIVCHFDQCIGNPKGFFCIKGLHRSFPKDRKVTTPIALELK